LGRRIDGRSDVVHLKIENRVVGGRAEIDRTVTVKSPAVINPPTLRIIHAVIEISCVSVFVEFEVLSVAITVKPGRLFGWRLDVDVHGGIGCDALWSTSIRELEQLIERRLTVERHAVIRGEVLVNSMIYKLRRSPSRRLVIQRHATIRHGFVLDCTVVQVGRELEFKR
jgi:hypothetical protein